MDALLRILDFIAVGAIAVDAGQLNGDVTGNLGLNHVHVLGLAGVAIGRIGLNVGRKGILAARTQVSIDRIHDSQRFSWTYLSVLNGHSWQQIEWGGRRLTIRRNAVGSNPRSKSHTDRADVLHRESILEWLDAVFGILRRRCACAVPSRRVDACDGHIGAAVIGRDGWSWRRYACRFLQESLPVSLIFGQDGTIIGLVLAKYLPEYSLPSKSLSFLCIVVSIMVVMNVVGSIRCADTCCRHAKTNQTGDRRRSVQHGSYLVGADANVCIWLGLVVTGVASWRALMNDHTVGTMINLQRITAFLSLVFAFFPGVLKITLKIFGISVDLLADEPSLHHQFIHSARRITFSQLEPLLYRQI